MAHPYRLILKKNLSPKAGEPEKLAYAIPAYNGTTDIEAICRIISSRSSLSGGDVKSVLDNLNHVLDLELRIGRIIHLGELGNLRVSLSSEGVTHKDQFSPSLMRKPKLIFKPGPFLQNTLLDLDYVREDKIIL